MGPVAAAEKTILINSTAIMLAIVVPTMLATAAVAFWFRRGNAKAVLSPRLGIFGCDRVGRLGNPGADHPAAGRHHLDRQPPARSGSPLNSKVPPVHVEVVSMDWKWLFIYPDQGIATVNQLVVPAGTPVNFRLTSATVWNAFFVPQMGSMIYTMPRMTTQLNLQADKPGLFEGRSAHFSGDGFPGMEFKVHSVTPQQFAAWAAGAKGSGPMLDARAYSELSKPSSDVKPMIFSGVAPDLFAAIVTGRAPATQQQLPHNKPIPRQAHESDFWQADLGRDSVP